MVNAMLWVAKTGSRWRMLPAAFPLENAAEDGSVPGPVGAVDAALRDWWSGLRRAADVEQLHLSVFGLPGARPSW